MILPATSHSLYREENRRNLVSGDVLGVESHGHTYVVRTYELYGLHHNIQACFGLYPVKQPVGSAVVMHM